MNQGSLCRIFVKPKIQRMNTNTNFSDYSADPLDVAIRAIRGKGFEVAKINRWKVTITLPSGNEVNYFPTSKRFNADDFTEGVGFVNLLSNLAQFEHELTMVSCEDCHLWIDTNEEEDDPDKLRCNECFYTHSKEMDEANRWNRAEDAARDMRLFN